MNVKQWLEDNSNIFSVWCIGLITAVITAYQVSSVKQKAEYESLKAVPQIEVLRRSDESGDFIEVVNHGGEIFGVSGEIYTFLHVQANVDPAPRIKTFFKPAHFSRPKQYSGSDKSIVLSSYHSTPFDTLEKHSYDFAVGMTANGLPSSASYFHLMKVEYRDIFGNEYTRYYRITNPGLPSFESGSIADTLSGLYLKDKFQWIAAEEDPLDTASKWIEAQFPLHKKT